MKNYRYFGEEADILGQRLDAARDALARSTTAWSRNYWNAAVERLLFQWQILPILHDAEAQITIIPRWTVSHDWYETDYSPGYDITDRVFDKLFRFKVDLTDSWERNREKRLAKAQ